MIGLDLNPNQGAFLNKPVASNLREIIPASGGDAQAAEIYQIFTLMLPKPANNHVWDGITGFAA